MNLLIFRAFGAGALILSLAGCAPESSSPKGQVQPDPTKSGAQIAQGAARAQSSGIQFQGQDAYTTINGEPMDRALLMAYIKQRGFDPNDPAQLTQAADKLGEFMALAQAAQKTEMAKTPEYALEQLKFAATSYIQSAATQPPVTEVDLRAFYDQQIKLADGVEFNIEQIAFANEVQARAAEAQLANGKPFAMLLAELNGKPGVGEARTVGWTNMAMLPTELHPPLAALKAGGAMRQAVQVKGAWQLLNVVETRPLTVQPFAEVKAVLQKRIEQERAAKAIEAVRASMVVGR